MVLGKTHPMRTQSLTDVAFYASEGCLVKMLYRAGFAGVYRVAVVPEHDDFRAVRNHLEAAHGPPRLCIVGHPAGGTYTARGAPRRFRPLGDFDERNPTACVA